MIFLAGCDGVLIDPAAPAPEPQVIPEPQPEPTPEPQPEVEVLVFSAKWCGACIRDKPRIEEMRQQGIKVTIIDYDENPAMFRQYGVTQMPTYVVLEDGVEVERTGSIVAVLSIISVILKIVILLLG
jgi:thiol-disulfide isomerase/thioredoxin